MSPEKNPQHWLEAWEALSEPVKAGAFSLLLGAAMILRSGEKRTLGKKLADVVAGGLAAFMLGYIADLAGCPSHVIWLVNGAAIMLGVDKLRSVIDTIVDGFVARINLKKGE